MKIELIGLGSGRGRGRNYVRRVLAVTVKLWVRTAIQKVNCFFGIRINMTTTKIFGKGCPAIHFLVGKMVAKMFVSWLYLYNTEITIKIPRTKNISCQILYQKYLVYFFRLAHYLSLRCRNSFLLESQHQITNR